MNKYTCECGKEFTNRNIFAGHQLVCPAHLLAIGKLVYHRCPTCGKEFTSAGLLKIHEYTHLTLEERRRITKPRSKKQCPICGNMIDSSNFQRHVNSCTGNIKTFYTLDHEGLECKFCGKVCKSRNALAQHELRCGSNPDRIQSNRSGFNSTGRPAWNKGLTAETDERVRKNVAAIKASYKNNPAPWNKYTFRPRSAKRCRYGTYKDYYCDSGWELAFLIYNLDNNVEIVRNLEPFEYELDGKKHKYYPDFIIDGVYYEIKGIYTDADHAKINQFPHDKKLIVIDSGNIDMYIKYCIERYGDYTLLYDRNYPSWLDKKDKNKDYNFKIK